MNIYELTAEYARLQEALERGAKTAEEEAELAEAFDEIHSSLEEKAEAYARIRNNMLAEVEAIKAEEQRLAAKRRIVENGIERLEKNIFDAMTLNGHTKIKSAIGTWRIQENPWSVNVLNIQNVPARFLIEQPPTVNKKAMLDEFKQSGELFEGVQFTRTKGLRFK